MKKLVFALMCLVSVAFFASCDPTVEHPEPAISVITNAGYLVDGYVADLDVEYPFGFTVASNAETNEELAAIAIYVDDEIYDEIEIEGDTYIYENTITWSLRRDVIGTSVITATVTDAAGKQNSVSMTISINEALLVPQPFQWYRLGPTQTGLEEFGLYWEKNIKATHAQIKPLEDVKLFVFDNPETWTNVRTAADKTNLFTTAMSETSQSQKPVYNNVSTEQGGTYDDVIGTVMPDGTCHLIHVTNCTIGEFQSAGYPITISGEAK